VVVATVEDGLLGGVRISDVIPLLAGELADAEDLFAAVADPVTFGVYLHRRGRLAYYADEPDNVLHAASGER
jgi:hypothetical protein